MTAALAAPSLTRIALRWLRLARIAWLVTLALTVLQISIGLPLRFQSMSQPCLASADDCRQVDYLIPEQIARLEALGISLETYARVDLIWFLFTTLVYAGIGLLIFWKRSNDWLALLVSAYLVYPPAGLGDVIAAAYPAWTTATDVVFNLGNILMFLFIALFPNGRFSPPWMRWYWLGMVLISLLPSSLWISNPTFGNLFIVIYWVSFLILGPYSQIYRFRHESDAIQRQQTKWVVLGFATFAGSALVGFALIGLLPEGSLGLALYNEFFFDAVALLIPLGIVFSVLRYRLWEVDLLIRRTLQYSLVTGVLALIFFGAVTILQAIFSSISGERSNLAIALSTLAIAALFNPLRKRIQKFIDRRFYRRKYDAEQALAEFATTARNETDLDCLTGKLTGAIQDTLQPSQLSLWLKRKPE